MLANAGGESPGRDAQEAALPFLLGSARASTAPSRPLTNSSGERHWLQTRGVRPSTSFGPGWKQKPRLPERRRYGAGTAPSSRQYAAEGAAQVQTVAQWIKEELALQGLEDNNAPSVERARVFSEALGQIMDLLPTYRPVLLLVQKEYNALIAKLCEEVHSVAAMGGRMKTLKAESLNFVTESMAWFQKGTSDMQRDLYMLQADNKRLNEERKQMYLALSALTEHRDEERRQAEDYHTTNMDIVRHLRRLETEIETLHRSEQDSSSQIGNLSMKLKEKDLRIQAVEAQLQAENKKVLSMISVEDHRELEERLHRSDQNCRELTERIEAVQHNYRQLLETYTKSSGQSFNDKDLTGSDARPLTPRPSWRHCHGSLDPESGSSVANAASAQMLLEHVLTSSRSVLSAYGLMAIAEKSPAFEVCASRARDKQAAGANKTNAKMSLQECFDMTLDEGANLFVDLSDTCLPSALLAELHASNDVDATSIPNLRFSRSKVLAFLDNLLQQRLRRGGVGSMKPFCDFMFENLPDEVRDTPEAVGYFLNMYTAARQYGVEPDFLSYILLFSGKIAESVVSDNKTLCGKLRAIFAALFEKASTRSVSKQKLFHSLREVLPNKSKEMWQDLMSHFPPGGPETMVSYEDLLIDDSLVLCPVVYTLRLQHLEEALALSERFQRVVESSAKAFGEVKVQDFEAGLEADRTLHGGLSKQALATVWGMTVHDLQPESVVDAGRCLAMLKQCSLYRTLYFPSLHEKSDELVTLRSRLEALEVQRKTNISP